jgi:3,2-trans-enoyl-CoA isomerase
VFTAGNDLMELYAPRTSRERYRNFWVVSNRVLLKLYKSRLATIAAIRGACPAGE